MSFRGFFDLCVNFDGSDKENLRRLLSRLYEMGYRTVAVNQTIDESALDTDKKKKKKGERVENDPLQRIVTPIDIEDVRDEFRDKLCILSRLTFVFSDSARTYSLGQLAGLKKFHIYGVIPKSNAALQFACSQLNVDIVTINSSSDGLRFSRKLYLQGVQRGVHFEIRYNDVVSRSTRKLAIHNAHSYHVYGKSRSVIVSSGASDSAMIRNPYDIINLGAILGLNETKARAAISEQCKHLILKAEGRRFGKAVFAIELTNNSPESSEHSDEDIPPESKQLKL